MKIKDLVKTASRYASFRYRKNTPPQYTLTKIMDIIEKLNTFRILEKHPRRIEEQKQAIGYYNTTQRGISSEFTKVEEPIQDVGRLQKNAELNALKAKLKPKNI